MARISADEALTAGGRKLLLEITDRHICHLRTRVREQEALSVPCPPGTWRWADVNTSGYGHKPPDELAADRARSVRNAASARDELQLLLAARRWLAAEHSAGDRRLT
jgi:hypothetical protein